MVRFMVGVDGSRISHKAFEVVASLMHDRDDEIVVVNIYRVASVGKIQFHLKSSPMVAIPIQSNLSIKEDGTVWLMQRETPEQVLVFLNGVPTEHIKATKEVETAGRSGHEITNFVGFVHQTKQGGHDVVFEGKFSSIDRKEDEIKIVAADKAFIAKQGAGMYADSADDIMPVDMLSPANRPAHLQKVYESKCLEYHILKHNVLTVAKPEGTTTKDLLVKLASDHKVDYMTLGSYGTKNKTNILGSSVDWFIEYSNVPLIIVRNSSHPVDRMDRKKLCMFVDDSSASEYAFERVVKDLCVHKPTNLLYAYNIFKEGEADRSTKVQDKFNSLMAEFGIQGTTQAVPLRPDTHTGDQITEMSWDCGAEFTIVAQHASKKWVGRVDRHGSTFNYVLNSVAGTSISYRVPTDV